jgi:hypothetical protein
VFASDGTVIRLTAAVEPNATLALEGDIVMESDLPKKCFADVFTAVCLDRYCVLLRSHP